MVQKGKKHKDDELLRLLVVGATVEAAANKTGLSERTIFRRKADPEFQHRLKGLQADMLQRLSSMLLATSSEALKTLVALLAPAIPSASRLGAARTIIKEAMTVRVVVDFEGRLAAVEQLLGRAPPA